MSTTDGDARDDVTYQFRFRTEIRNPDTFLYNTGPIDSLSDPDWNMPQTYSVTQVRVGRSSDVLLGTNLPTPPVNIGPRSIPNYECAARIGDPHARERHQGVRRAGGRSVLRRSRFGIRSGGPAAVQSAPRHPAPERDRTWTASLATTRTRLPSRCRSTAARSRGGGTTDRTARARIGIYASASRPGAADQGRGTATMDDDQVRAGVATRQPVDQRGGDPARQKDGWNTVGPRRRRALPGRDIPRPR